MCALRSTLIIDDDIMHLARDLAKVERKPVSAVISELAREGYESRCAALRANGSTGPDRDFGRLPDRRVVVTNEHLNALRERLGV
ncbi:MAG: hypothetical protein LBG60_14585 [Bifidobacteriaceae bacterium]|jgi:hypothetical protein|nr:hypothetical protein [Bifidobacteriaceae bacterium]